MNAHLKNIPVLLNSNSAKTKHIINSLNLLQIPFVLHDIFNKTGRVLNLYAVKVPRVAEFNESLIQITRAAFYKKLNLDEIKIPFRKLHVSRGKAKRRKIINENKLIDILQHNGFQTVFLEDYSLEEQIILLSEAKVIISAHGAGLTNIIFMNKETTVIELKAYNNDYWCFYSLARLSGLKYKYLLCESDHYNHRNANIRVDISKITELIHKV